MAYSNPSHPSEVVSRTKNPAQAAKTISLTLHGRDPHDIPSFKGQPPTTPILYLPPLLSSLPHDSEPSSTDEAGEYNPHPALVTATRLPDIDPASLSLHRALHRFRPLSDAYAAVPYDEAFNWNELTLGIDEEREWYCVVFRSKRKAGSDGGSLYEADKLAHEEAIRNGGLILYWYGIPNPKTGLNLATCIWQSRAHALAANGRPHHIKAMRLAAAAYEVYDLERRVLRKVKGKVGVTVEEFGGGEVGW